jgi:hypothetical protein
VRRVLKETEAVTTTAEAMSPGTGPTEELMTTDPKILQAALNLHQLAQAHALVRAYYDRSIELDQGPQGAIVPTAADYEAAKREEPDLARLLRRHLDRGDEE